MHSFIEKDLLEGETKRTEAKQSRAAIAVTWLCLPVFFVLTFCITYLPTVIATLANNELKNTAASILGIEGEDFGVIDAFQYAQEEILSLIPDIIWILLAIPFVMLVLAWIAWACYTTSKQLKNELIATNMRYIARSGKKLLCFHQADIRNVTIEKSIWGKLFGYGNLYIRTKEGTITVKYISDPEYWKKEFTTDYI